jgi:hypothetical protein
MPQDFQQLKTMTAGPQYKEGRLIEVLPIAIMGKEKNWGLWKWLINKRRPHNKAGGKFAW